MQPTFHTLSTQYRLCTYLSANYMSVHCVHACGCMYMCVHACACVCTFVHVYAFCASVSVSWSNHASGMYTPNELHSGIPPLRCKMVILVVHTQ